MITASLFFITLEHVLEITTMQLLAFLEAQYGAVLSILFYYFFLGLDVALSYNNNEPKWKNF